MGVRRAIVPLLVLLAAAGCQEKKSKAERYAESEQKILRKMEMLRERQQQITTKLAELEQRLVVVRRRRHELENRWAEPTPAVRPTRVSAD